MNDVQYWSEDRHREYHLQQFREPYRSTVALAEFVREVASDERLEIRRALDVGCGAGAVTHFLARAHPGTSWIGVDAAEEYLEIGRRLIASLDDIKSSVELRHADFYNLSHVLPPASFDLVLSVQTLSWLESYEDALIELVAMTRPGGVLVVTSLFTEFFVDVCSRVVEYPDGRFDAPRRAAFYNVYCFDRFASIAHAAGATVVATRLFEIDVPLDPPENKLMGTHTRRIGDGRFLQFSGPLVLPWRFVALRRVA